MNLRSFDLNLLVIFQAIATQGSVIGAAEQVGLSPSAVSHALARLRTMFNDELFYRSSNGLQPTQRALDICKEIAVGLSHISNAIGSQNSFEPGEDDRNFTIQVSEYVQEFLLPRLTGVLRRVAPRIAVQITPYTPSATGGLESVDVQIRPPSRQGDPATTRQRLLTTDRYLVMMNPDHAAVRDEMDAERFASLEHVVVSQASACTSTVDEALARRGLSRRIVMSVPSWHELPEIIALTDLVTIVPSRRVFEDPRLNRLVSVPLPLDEVEFALGLYWDARRDRDPGNRWLRQVIARIFAEESVPAGPLARQRPLPPHAFAANDSATAAAAL